MTDPFDRISDRFLDGYRNGRADRWIGNRIWISYSSGGEYGRGYREGWERPEGGIVEEQEVKLKLDELAANEMEAGALAERKAKQKADDLDDMEREVLKAVAARNAEIDAELAPEERVLVAREQALRVEIQRGVEGIARTVRGIALMAVYSGPKDLVDVAQLRGYAAAHPEVAPFFSKSKPSVSIRKIQAKIEVKEGDPLPF